MIFALFINLLIKFTDLYLSFWSDKGNN